MFIVQELFFSSQITEEGCCRRDNEEKEGSWFYDVNTSALKRITLRHEGGGGRKNEYVSSWDQ